MDDGFDIPIGGDLQPLRDALADAVAAIERVGQKITAAFERANASVAASVAQIGALSAGSTKAASASAQAGNAAGSASQKFAALANTAINVGSALSGAATAFSAMSRASRALSGVSLAGHLSALVARAGGLRAAFSRIPAAMTAIASNPALRRVLIGATAAAGAIIAIRAAWRTAAAGARALQSAAAGSFRAVVSGARSAAAAVRSTFASVRSAPGKLMGALPGGAGLLAGIGGIAGALTLAMGSISKAAEMETLETAFAPLIGGTEAAKKRIKELNDFAAATPFELPEVAQASRVLEVLTKGALATGNSLRLVGDVAAGTQQPFQEIAMWIGRLYDGLQSGRPVGEAMMRLQELGAVSGEVRSRIEALQKSGAAGPQIWNEASAALGRFGGAMARQAETWTGKLSTLKGEIAVVMAQFGKPIIDGLKPFLDMAIAQVVKMRDKAAEFGNKIKMGLNYFQAAFQTGQTLNLVTGAMELAMINAVNKFTAGMIGSVAFLKTSLGGILTGFQNGLKASGLWGALESLFVGIGKKFTATILEGMSKVPGMRGLAEESSRLRMEGGAELHFARLELAALDLAGGISLTTAEIIKALEEGKAAFAEATKKPLLNPAQAIKKLEHAKGLLKGQVEANSAEIARRQAEMDANAKRPSATTNPAAAFEKIARATAPAVTSLGRVGGGGFGSFTPMVAEQRKANALLKTIVKNTQARAPLVLPVIA